MDIAELRKQVQRLFGEPITPFKYDFGGAGGVPVAVGGSGPHPSMARSTKEYSTKAISDYLQLQEDDAAYRKHLRDSADFSWADPKASGHIKVGPSREAVPSLSMVENMAPAYQGALYNNPRKWPGIQSIVNIKGRMA
jgi:hypothetical protein